MFDLLPAVSIVGSVAGAAGTATRPDGGNGGHVDIRSGVDVNTGLGGRVEESGKRRFVLQDITESMILGVHGQETEYQVRQVYSPSFIELTIRGNVTIRSQFVFNASVTGDFNGKQPPSLTIAAGQPLLIDPPPHLQEVFEAGGFPGYAEILPVPHGVNVDFTPDADDPLRDGGNLTFHTVARGDVSAFLNASGGDGVLGGDGGTGGQIVLAANDIVPDQESSSSSLNRADLVISSLAVQGGEGGSFPSQGTTGSPGGRGGDAGTIALRASGIKKYEGTSHTPTLSIIGGHGGDGMEGRVGLAGTPLASPQPGAPGGHGGPGGTGGAAHIVLEQPADAAGIQVHLQGGNGGAGGRGGPGGPGLQGAGAPGGDGGDGGDSGTSGHVQCTSALSNSPLDSCVQVRGDGTETPGKRGLAGIGGASAAGPDGRPGMLGSPGTFGRKSPPAMPPPPQEEQPDVWTIMVYLSGDHESNSGDVGRFLDELERVNTSDQPINVVIQMDRPLRSSSWLGIDIDLKSPAGRYYKIPSGPDWSGWTNTRRGWLAYNEVTSFDPLLSGTYQFATALPRVDPRSESELDAADPATLRSFVAWSKEVAPAERYALVVWGHGASWGGLLTDDCPDAKCTDEAAGHMTLDEFGGVFKGPEGVGYVDLLVTGTCTNMVAEFEPVLRHTVGYFVGSEELTQPRFFENGRVMEWLVSNIERFASPEDQTVDQAIRDFGKAFVELRPQQTAEYPNVGRFSLVDVKAMKDVTVAVTRFVNQALQDMPAVRRELWERIAEIRDRLPDVSEFGFGSRDLKGLMQGIANDDLLPSGVRQKAEEVVKAVEQAVVLNQADGALNDQEVTGMAIYAPHPDDTYFQSRDPRYDDLKFEQLTSWRDFLGRIPDLRSETPDSGTEPEAPWQNKRNRFDVNHDEMVTPLDVALVIADLQLHGARALPATPPAGGPLLDVNGDNFATPLDVAQLMPQLTHMAEGEGEPAAGESTVIESSPNPLLQTWVDEQALKEKRARLFADDAQLASQWDQALLGVLAAS